MSEEEKETGFNTAEKAKAAAEGAKKGASALKQAIDRLPLNSMVQKIPALAKFAGFANYAACALAVLIVVGGVALAAPNKAEKQPKSSSEKVAKAGKKDTSDPALKGEWKNTKVDEVFSFDKGKFTYFWGKDGSMTRGTYTTDSTEYEGVALGLITFSWEEDYDFETGKWTEREKPGSSMLFYHFAGNDMLNTLNEKDVEKDYKRGTYLKEAVAKATADAKKAKEIKGMSLEKAEKVVKGAKDAASAFATIASLIDNGNIDAALSAIDAAKSLVNKEKATPESLFRYELTKDGSGVRLLGRAAGTNFSGTLVFPDTIEGLPVKEIEGFRWIDDGVMASVTAIIVPEGVTYFEGFNGKALVYVSLPSTIEKISGYTFSSDEWTCCPNLVRIDIPENAPLEEIPKFFAGKTSLAQFKFPSAVKKIGSHAFEKTKLTSVELPAGLQDIYSGAFYYCSKLTEVIVPEGMGKIECDGIFIFNGTHLNLKSQAALKAIGYTGNF